MRSALTVIPIKKIKKVGKLKVNICRHFLRTKLYNMICMSTCTIFRQIYTLSKLSKIIKFNFSSLFFIPQIDQKVVSICSNLCKKKYWGLLKFSPPPHQDIKTNYEFDRIAYRFSDIFERDIAKYTRKSNILTTFQVLEYKTVDRPHHLGKWKDYARLRLWTQVLYNDTLFASTYHYNRKSGYCGNMEN